MSKNNNSDSISKELLTFGYEQIAAFDEDATSGDALAYYENAQIEDATVYQNKLSGRVGNFFESFDVRITVRENEISCTCGCDSERKICLHAISLLYAWVNDGRDFKNIHAILDEIRKMDKERLMEIVTNIIRRHPHFTELFFEKHKPEWDEIDEESLS